MYSLASLASTDGGPPSAEVPVRCEILEKRRQHEVRELRSSEKLCIARLDGFVCAGGDDSHLASGSGDYRLGINAGTWGQRSWVYGPYVQDDWRVTDHLTLNLGLRWEYNQPWYEVFNRQANFGPYSGIEYIAGQSGCPYSSCRALYNSYNKDFEPRIGFAYTPSFLGKSSVVRGAYTISSFLEGTGTNLRLPLNPPFQTEFTNLYDSTSPPYTQYFPGSTTDQGLAVLTAPTNPLAGAQIRLWDPNVRPDIVQQWNFSVEHQFAGDMLLFLGYVGQHGTHFWGNRGYAPTYFA